MTASKNVKIPGQFGRKAQPGFPPACVPCRKVKMRCIRDAPDSPSCQRCIRLTMDCETTPLLKVGRKKGSTNDSRSLQRAVERLRAELRDSQSKTSSGSSETQTHIYTKLQQLLQDQENSSAPSNSPRDSPSDSNRSSSTATATDHAGAACPNGDIPVAPYSDNSTQQAGNASRSAQAPFAQAADMGVELPSMAIPDMTWLSYTNLDPSINMPVMPEPLSDHEPFQVVRTQPASSEYGTFPSQIPLSAASGSNKLSPRHKLFAIPPATSSPSANTITSTSSKESNESYLPPKTKATLHPGAHNPLGVLAYAAENSTGKEVPISSWDLQSLMQEPHNSLSFAHKLLSDPATVMVGKQTETSHVSRGLASLFSATSVSETKAGLGYYRKQPSLKRDDDPSFDPVGIGLVDEHMLDGLFATFFAKLNPFMGILDPDLHSPTFVRRRSYLLLTWILASAALFTPSMSSLATRLRLHGENLSKVIHAAGYISVEIIQAYYIAVTWQKPAASIADELTWLYTHHIFGLVRELGMAQSHWDAAIQKDLSGQSGSRSQFGVISSHPAQPVIWVKGQAINAPRWFDEVSLEEHGHEMEDGAVQRLMRNGERTYLRVVIWERALAAAFGRASYSNEPTFTENIETWWTHPVATATDRYTSALTIMRRLFASLPEEVLSHMQMPYFNKHPHRIIEHVDDVLSPWVSKWLGKNEREPNESLSRVYMRTCFNHGRLWVLSFTINSRHSTPESSKFFEQRCFDLAIDVSETLLQDFARTGDVLFGMMTPTWAMIAYACHLAVRLFPNVHGTAPAATARLLGICGEVAALMEKAGTTPSHRFSSAAIFGRHLHLILRAKARALLEDHKTKSLENFVPNNSAFLGNHTTTRLLSQGASPTAVLSSSLLDGMNNADSSSSDLQWLWNDNAWSDILTACLGGESYGGKQI